MLIQPSKTVARQSGKKCPASNSVRPNFSRFIPRGVPVAVALSGGADSMALTLLLTEQGYCPTALIVDHGLRPESGEEATHVQGWMRTRDIPCVILKAPLPQTHTRNLMHRARVLRYEVMENWCKNNGVMVLALGHHLDDQWETQVMRSARKSVLGLGGMPAIRYTPHLKIIRPMLGFKKEELKTYLREQKQEWIEDPTNTNAKFDRVKIRQNQSAPENNIESPPYPRGEYEKRLARWMVLNTSATPEGYIVFNTLDESDLSAHALGHVIQWMNGNDYPPRWEELLNALSKAPHNATTLGGCYLFKKKDKYILVRESAQMNKMPLLSSPFKYDERYYVTFSHGQKDREYTIAPVTESGWIKVQAKAGIKTDLDKRIVFSLPAIFHLDDPVMIPHLNWVHKAHQLSLQEVKITLQCPHPLAGSFFKSYEALS